MQSFIYEIEDELGNAFDVDVYYDISPYVPERLYLSNGDPGYPAEPRELEFFEVVYQGENITDKVSEKWQNILIDKCFKGYDHN